jgi:hypothetical protein
VTTVFSFPYYFLAEGDLVVISTAADGVETTKTLTTHYTVTGEGEPAGGSVTMLTAPASGTTLTIYNDPDQIQEVDLRENDSLPAEAVEEALDRLTMIAQRLSTLITNVVKLSNGFVGTFDTTLPSDLSGVADAVPVTDATGEGWADAADWPTTTDLANAETNATAAAASASAAASSASAAAASAAAVIAALPFTDVVYKTFSDSPITLTTADTGKLISIDCTSGAVAVTLPSIAAMTAEAPVLILKKSDSSVNKVTYTRAGSDTIEGATSDTLDTQGAGVFLIADTDQAPDAWAKLEMGTSGSGGGGGGSLRFIEGANSPVKTFENEIEIYEYEPALSQALYVSVRVPQSYVTGSPVNLRILWTCAATSGDALINAVATLIRSEVDEITSTTNQRTTTNAAVTLSAANDLEPQKAVLDISSSTGQINGVSISAGDLIKVKVQESSSTVGSVIKLIADASEVTFS